LKKHINSGISGLKSFYNSKI